MKLSELFISSAETGRTDQRDDGAMPAGTNGPHGDPETPVRCTSHWLILFLEAYRQSGNTGFEDAAARCLYYLKSREARPMGATFFHRKNPKKDFSNGVMGQAWTIEALVHAYRHWGDDDALQTAEELFNLHPYNKSVQCWSVVNVDGSIRGFDTTFNHQLWFASMGCRLMNEGVESVKKTTLHFIDHIESNIELYPDGVIQHRPYGYARRDTPRKTAGQLVHRLKEKLRPNRALYSHSLGYHGFNAYALAVIRTLLPDHSLFSSDIYKKSIELYRTERIEDEMAETTFGYPYNPPGIEAAVSIEKAGFLTDDEKKSMAGRWLQNQFAHSFNFKSRRMERNTPDPVTLQARLYELYSLDSFEYDIEIPPR